VQYYHKALALAANYLTPKIYILRENTDVEHLSHKCKMKGNIKLHA